MYAQLVHTFASYCILLLLVTAFGRTSDARPRIGSLEHWFKTAIPLAFVVAILAGLGFALNIHPVLPIAIFILLPLMSMGLLAFPLLLFYQWITVPPGSTIQESSGYNEYKFKRTEALKLIGEIGFAKTDLRPLGSIDIAGKIWIAEVQNNYINVTCPVQVVAVKGTLLIVEESATPPPSNPPPLPNPAARSGG